MKVCRVDSCDRPIHGRGYCTLHCARDRKGIPLDRPMPRPGEWSEWAITPAGYNRRNKYYTVDGQRFKEYQLEHRYVMEQVLGRKLTKEETVHHINGNRIDNRPENLELWASRQPRGQRVEDLVAYAREILELYG